MFVRKVSDYLVLLRRCNIATHECLLHPYVFMIIFLTVFVLTHVVGKTNKVQADVMMLCPFNYHLFIFLIVTVQSNL